MFRRLFQRLTANNSIAFLDGFRALACLSVVTYHLNLITSNDLHLWRPWPDLGFWIATFALSGGSGVTLFFVMSGFLLFLPYAKSIYTDRAWPSLGSFYLRRMLRIWPAYYVSLIVILFWQGQEYLKPERWGELALFATFFMSSVPETFQKLNGPFWTLAIEWQFYLLLPFLAWGLSKIAGRGTSKQRFSRVSLGLALIAIWGIGTHYLNVQLLTIGPETKTFTPPDALAAIIHIISGTSGNYLEDFAVGMFLSSFYVLCQDPATQASFKSWQEWVRRYIAVFLIVGLSLIGLMMFWDGNRRFGMVLPKTNATLFYNYSYFSELLFSIAFACFITALLFGPAYLRKPLEWPLFRFLGLISYGLYIWHLPFLLVYRDFVQSFIASWNPYFGYISIWLFLCVVIVPFSTLFYFVIEYPWVRLGSRLRQPKRLLQSNSEEIVNAKVIESVVQR